MRQMSRSDLTEADRIVLHAIVSSPDRMLFGAKRLQKLLFIAHHPRTFGLKHGRPLRSFRFVVYKHGPFAQGIYESISRLEERGLIEVESRDLTRAPAMPVSPDDADEDAPPMQVRVYRAREGAEDELVGADEHDLRVVTEAAKRWGWLSSEQVEALVLIRTGLTPALKSRYAGVEWSTFERLAADEIPRDRPEPPRAFWRAQQQFFKERARLLRKFGPGHFVAYIEGDRVGMGLDEVELYKSVRAARGQPPDYIGFLSETGRQLAQALAAR